MKKSMLVSAIILIALTACSYEPEPIRYGEDNCDLCKMQISDHKFGTEILTSKGKAIKFDSIECMADYSSKLNPDHIESFWVTDFSNAGKLISIEEVKFLRSDELRSPMGLSLLALSDETELRDLTNKFGGEELSWNEVQEYVKKEWHD
ncbi:MAG: nitrous oxide reductase accessory protein NosL [Melioribacteraceae bacterium]|nr:nitrous oxide reductase accessory protein NosL [Melioribacteraceae bacterium]MCF8354966.1 nitrous oxide reductase accessory protein NosL [Melioribacteraceae bacterium]MCF8394017.1 nitrous oxide reductase accessory protein NosL [Melioribacteraceae bacterium]MCF8419780.1 nitrous oxide reductase accessory protein NosL [Melioribacteraceae bacterium]